MDLELGSELLTGNLEKFINMCETAKTPDDLTNLVNFMVNLNSDGDLDRNSFLLPVYFKSYYNKHIGWGVPSDKALKYIFNAFQKHLETYPEARLIDVGAGTGLYSALLFKMGIPASKLVALDLVVRTHRPSDITHDFYPITTHTTEEPFKILPTDALLVVWGAGCWDIVMEYAKTGTCIIVQGECDGGCTFPTNWVEYIEDIENWMIDFIEYGLYSLASSYAENISVTIRK